MAAEPAMLEDPLSVADDVPDYQRAEFLLLGDYGFSRFVHDFLIVLCFSVFCGMLRRFVLLVPLPEQASGYQCRCR